MSDRYPGSFITKSPTTPTRSSASGVWNLAEAAYYTKLNLWPLPPLSEGVYAMFAGGWVSSNQGSSGIEYVTIASSGNSVEFASLVEKGGFYASFSTDTRAVLAGGGGSGSRTIQYMNPLSTGTSSQFGQLSTSSYYSCGGANPVRGLINLGYTSGFSNILEYITIASTGNSVDFGDLTVNGFLKGCTNSSIKALFGGGYIAYGTTHSNADVVNFASLGNATDFGSLSVTRYSITGISNGVRGVYAGGSTWVDQFTSSYHNVIEYTTINTGSTFSDFGDLTFSVGTVAGAANNTRGLFAGGGNNSGSHNVIQYITISTTGNASDFGDLTGARDGVAGYSNSAQSTIYATPSSTNELAYFFGGWSVSSAYESLIQYVQISTTGNTNGFGDLYTAVSSNMGCGSSTRGISFGGYAPSISWSNKITYFTYASFGEVANFGNLTEVACEGAAFNSSTRGVRAGGYKYSGDGFPDSNVMDYITIASTGNATDFGDMSTIRHGQAGFSSSTRGIIAGGSDGTNRTNVIEYVTIASAGNTTDFGDILSATYGCYGSSNSTTGLIAGGSTGSYINVIQYITIASTGNATDFGDLTLSRGNGTSAAGSTRALFAGGYVTNRSNIIDYVTIASTGNATDFGDLERAIYVYGACSNNNGGVQ